MFFVVEFFNTGRGIGKGRVRARGKGKRKGRVNVCQRETSISST